MYCPCCGCDRFRFRHPLWKRRITAPFTEKVIALINLLTDPDFKEPGEPNLLMIFNCTQCEWSFIKPEGTSLQVAFTRAQEQ